MTKIELLPTERKYYDMLSEQEQELYNTTNKQLSVIDELNDYFVHSFVEAAQQLNELSRLHQRYNDITDFIYTAPDKSDDQLLHLESLYDINEELFSMSITVGKFSTISRLMCMDECDALYEYLSKIKINRFGSMVDNVDVDVLIKLLITHDCY